MIALPSPTSYRAGAGMRMRQGQQGPSFAASQSAPWQHPWQTTPVWCALNKNWYATVTPGLVGCRAPIYRTSGAAQAALGLSFPTNPQTGNSFGINPLTGEPFFSASVFNRSPAAGGSAAAAAAAASASIDIPIYYAPGITMSWRALGFDGDPSEPVPQFFLDRGVVSAPPAETEDELESGDDTTQTPPTPKNLRLLRACDVYLHQPRPGLTSVNTLDSGALATGAAPNQQTLSIAAPSPTDALQVLSGIYTPPTPAADGIDPLTGDYTQPTWDEIPIATVYVLSPPNTNLDSVPDGTWAPYVKHALFWNLTYIVPFFRLPAVQNQITNVAATLAGGAAATVINPLTSDINQEEGDEANAISALSLTGTFYTPTGGGSTSAFPPAPAPTPAGITGLDKAGAIAAAAQAAAAAIANEQLDPPFPYFTMPFSAALL